MRLNRLERLPMARFKISSMPFDELMAPIRASCQDIALNICRRDAKLKLARFHPTVQKATVESSRVLSTHTSTPESLPSQTWCDAGDRTKA